MEMNETLFEQNIMENGVLHIIMQAPHNNLMTGEFFTEYEKVMQSVEKRVKKSEIKGVIISGKGRHFSVGADVESLAERSSDDLSGMTSDHDFSPGHIRQKHMVTFLYDLPVPVISAVTGFCIGSGSEIAINSHIRVCDKTAKIGQPESTFGILPGLGGIARTAAFCGMNTAFEMVMSGELMSAQEAYDIGWANLLTDKKQAIPEAIKLMDWLLTRSEPYKRKYVPQYIAEFCREG